MIVARVFCVDDTEASGLSPASEKKGSFKV